MLGKERKVHRPGENGVLKAGRNGRKLRGGRLLYDLGAKHEQCDHAFHSRQDALLIRLGDNLYGVELVSR